MNVIAIKAGYSGMKRRRVGEKFEMPIAELVKHDKDGKPVYEDGKLVMTSWVELEKPADTIGGYVVDKNKKAEKSEKPKPSTAATLSKEA